MAGTGKSSGGNGCTCGQRGQRNSTHSSYNYSILSPVMITVSHSLSPLPSLPHSAVHHLLDWHRLLSGYIKWNLKQRCSKNTCVCVKYHIYQNPVSLFSTLINSFPSCLLSSSLTCSQSKDEGGKSRTWRGSAFYSELMHEEIGSLRKFRGATMALLSMDQCDRQKEGGREGRV